MPVEAKATSTTKLERVSVFQEPELIRDPLLGMGVGDTGETRGRATESGSGAGRHKPGLPHLTGDGRY